MAYLSRPVPWFYCAHWMKCHERNVKCYFPHVPVLLNLLVEICLRDTRVLRKWLSCLEKSTLSLVDKILESRDRKASYYTQCNERYSWQRAEWFLKCINVLNSKSELRLVSILQCQLLLPLTARLLLFQSLVSKKVWDLPSKISTC